MCSLLGQHMEIGRIYCIYFLNQKITPFPCWWFWLAWKQIYFKMRYLSSIFKWVWLIIVLSGQWIKLVKLEVVRINSECNCTIAKGFIYLVGGLDMISTWHESKLQPSYQRVVVDLQRILTELGNKFTNNQVKIVHDLNKTHNRYQLSLWLS